MRTSSSFRRGHRVGRPLKAGILALCAGLGYAVLFFSEKTLGRDTSPPVLQPSVSGTPGANGWYTGNVSLSYSVSDPELRITNKSGCDSVSLTTDTAGTRYTCSATSSGGTSSQSVVLKRDAVPPKVTVTTPDIGATYQQGQTVKADYSVFTLLPPFNTLNSQLVVNGKRVNSTNSAGFQLSYESMPDPASSGNTSRRYKTNFWDYDRPAQYK